MSETSFLGSLEPFLPYLLILVLLLLLVAVLLMVLVLRRAARKATSAKEDGEEGEAAETPPLPDPEPDVRAALAAMRTRIGGRDYRYRMPWLLLLGQQDSAKSALLEGSTGETTELCASASVGDAACRFWFYDTGIVLDPAPAIAFTEGDAGEAAWQRFERLLIRYRSERPLDGVIVAISADFLARSDPSDDDELAKRAQRIYERLSSLQLAVGLRLPVYLLITRSETLPGFAEMARALPLSVRDNMFGWSNPSPADTAYTTRWIDDAFDSLFGDVMRLQLEAFADRETIADRDGLFLLPHKVRGLTEPVRRITDSIFRDTAYREDFAFRGIYFAGTLGSAAPTPVPAEARLDEAAPDNAGRTAPVQAGGSGDRRTVFLRDLLIGKVFREPGLARPTHTTYLARDRRIRWIQAGMAATLVLGLIWLIEGGRQLNALDEAAQPIIHDLMAYVEASQGDDARSATGGEGMATPQQGSAGGHGLGGGVPDALSLLDGMSRIDADWLIKLYPSYWLTDLPHDIERALEIALRRIMADIHHGFGARFATITAIDPAQFSDEIMLDGLSPALRNAQFLALRTFVTRLLEWERQAGRYERLRTNRDLAPLAPLVEYLFGASLPRSFERRPDFYLRSLQIVPIDPLDIEYFSEQAQQTFIERVRGLADALAGNTSILQRMLTLQSAVRALPPQASVGHGAEQQFRLRTFRQAVAAFDSAREAFGLPLGAWIDSPDPRFGEDYQQIMQDAEASRLLTAGSVNPVRSLQRGRDQAHERLRRRLAQLTAPLTGRLLASGSGDDVVNLAFADSAAELDSALTSWLARPFMADVDNPRQPVADPWLSWRTARLAEAVALYEDYLLFQVQDLAEMPRGLRPSVETTAKQQLQVHLLTAVAAAQQRPQDGGGPPAAGDEAALRRAVVDFRSAAPQLIALIDHVNQLQLSDATSQLRNVVRTQAQALLQRVDQQVEDENLYRLTAPAAPGGPASGGGSDLRAVNQYLTAQRSRITDLANNLAQPLLRVLTRATVEGGEGGDPGQLVQRWQGIRQALQAYANQQPGSTLAQLEQTIRAVYGDQNACQAVQGQSTAQNPVDFFDARRLDILETVRLQCRQLATSDVLTNYDRLSASFNRLLAGRFPFSTDPGRPRDPQLNPSNLRTFFAQYDALAESLPEDLQNASLPDAARQQALAFVQNIADARAFFAAYLASDPSAGPPAFILEPQFRVNRNQSQRSDEIAEWVLSTGGQAVRRAGDGATVDWVYGQPIQVRLRWPIGYAVAPVGDADQPALSVVQQQPEFGQGLEHTAVFAYDGPWALLAMARQQADPGGGSRQVLRFQVPVQFLAEDRQNQTPEPANAVVFIRVTPREPPPPEGPDQPGQRLVIPAFPSAAPSLPAPSG